jgi:hypothetical protein
MALLLLITPTACGAGKDKQASLGAVAKDDAVVLASQQAGPNREVIYTGTLVVRVPSVTKAREEAAGVAARAGGFVSTASADGDDARMTIRVPSSEFDGTMDRLAGLGRELQRGIKAQDVTAEVVDVEGRLKTAQASADRLRTLLSSSGSASDVVAVEAELAKREAEIESQQGRLRVLNDQVSLATVNLRLTKRDDLEVSKDLPGFLGGLRAGIVAVVNVAQGLLVVIGFLLPFVPYAAGVWWLVRRYRRRHPRQPRATAPAPAWPQPPTGTGSTTSPPAAPPPGSTL